MRLHLPPMTVPPNPVPDTHEGLGEVFVQTPSPLASLCGTGDPDVTVPARWRGDVSLCD